VAFPQGQDADYVDTVDRTCLRPHEVILQAAQEALNDECERIYAEFNSPT
jgi:hypothetical protein